jgi:hypothetical protein
MVLSEKGDTSWPLFWPQSTRTEKKHVLTKHEDPKRYLTTENFEQEKNRNTWNYWPPRNWILSSNFMESVNAKIAVVVKPVSWILITWASSVKPVLFGTIDLDKTLHRVCFHPTNPKNRGIDLCHLWGWGNGFMLWEGVANFDPDFEDKVDVISPILAYWS